ncbi:MULTISPECIES: hypothetical protein [Corallincola]|uniref:hypothetical protein n=1 Tax=Corallincola TaxID=1775176 RepID=UPI0013EE983C|nr:MULTISPECIES: hypothetical protein [Corallincola]
MLMLLLTVMALFLHIYFWLFCRLDKGIETNYNQSGELEIVRFKDPEHGPRMV